MALIWMDGFDLYAVNGARIDGVMRSSLYANAVGFMSDATRTGQGKCLLFNHMASGSEIRRAFELKDEIVVGFAWKTGMIDVLRNICEFRYDNHFGSSVTQFSVFMAGDGAISLANYHDNGYRYKAFDTGPNILFPNVWHYIEIRIKFHDTQGRVQVRVDNQTCLEYVGRTKRSDSPAACNIFRSGNYYLEDVMNNSVYLDDLYILDTSGDEFNDFLGDVVVHGLLPVYDGDQNELSLTGGEIAHYTAVDEVSPDEDGSYLSGNEVGKRELFRVDEIPSNVINVLAMSVHARAKKDAAGASNLKLLAKYDDELSESGVQPVTTTYVTRQKIFERAPDGGSWTKAKAQSTQIGFEVA